LVSCDRTDYGCQGGYLSNAWAYLAKDGTVSEDCFPYASQSGTAPSCAKTCKDGSAQKKYKCKANSIAHPTTVAGIQAEIYTSGPVEGGFSVYEDFYNYQSGVYVHTTGSLLGGHAIKILGWGTEKNVDYWLVANSWGTSWGESGFFRIKQGDCGINDQIYACTPDVTATLF
jgi:cathepsin B